MTAAALLEQSADECVTLAEQLARVATELRSSAILINLDTPAERLRHIALTIEAEAVRLATAAVQAARAGERVATTCVLEAKP